MEASAPISLYLDLEEGESANIEVVARAALAWAAAIKELAFVVDPAMDIQVELISGTEGSLGLNACIKAVSKVTGKYPKLATVVITSLTWFALETGAYTYEKVLDWLTGANAPAAVSKMTPDEIKEIAKEVVKAQEGEVAAQPRKQVFQELSQDRSIKGVGSTQELGRRPSFIIPRADFSAMGGQSVISSEQEAKKRTESSRMVVTLISPTLKDAERRWRFQSGSLPEFGATMKDHEFLTAIVTGRVAIPLRAGIEMEVELETKQELVGDLWTVKERNITKVYRPGVIAQQEGLPFSPLKD